MRGGEPARRRSAGAPERELPARLLQHLLDHAGERPDVADDQCSAALLDQLRAGDEKATDCEQDEWDSDAPGADEGIEGRVNPVAGVAPKVT